MEEKAGNDDLQHEVHLHLQGLQKDGLPPGLQDTKGPLHHTSGPGQPGTEPALHSIPDRLTEWCEQRYWLRQARVTAIANKMPAWRWVQLAKKKGAASQDPGNMDTTGKAHDNVQKTAFVVTNGLKLNGVEKFPVKIISRKASRWHDADVAPMNASCHPPKYWGT